MGAFTTERPESKPSMPWYHRPAFAALISVLFGILGAIAAPLLSGKQLAEVTLGVLAAVAALQLGELWQFHARSPRLASLEDLLTDQTLFDHAQRVLEASTKIAGVAEANPAFAALFQDRRDAALGFTKTTLQELADGTIRIENPDEQYSVAVDLVGGARHTVGTVSYRDEVFWTLAAGARYLEHNSRLIGAGGLVERVFVFDDEHTAISQSPVIVSHASRGVHVWVLPQARTLLTDKEDYVIYDDSAVRHARPVDATGSRKEATLTIGGPIVDQYRQRFNNLKLKSLSAQEYFLDLRDRGMYDGEIPGLNNAPSRAVRRLRAIRGWAALTWDRGQGDT